ncbi:MAG: hypothetical protein GY764_13295 [Halieaceae bacterium]|nr:hypothetical protein [Halieaceae bacterium]
MRRLGAEPVINKPDIVALKWVIGLIKSQTDAAESALVEFGDDPTQKQALLRCMWSVHQITSTFKALGLRKAEMLTLEMERSLNFLYKGKIVDERRKLAMGGLMQALKIIPAYLEHTEAVRVDTGRGLEHFVNDLRRWSGEKPRSGAFFFSIEIPLRAGITGDAVTAGAEEIQSRANVMLALYLEMAKQALRGVKIVESMKTVARVARKMQELFAGTEAERYWFAMIGLCEGIAAGLIKPDDCIAQIFKSGAFSIKYARENGDQLDQSIDYSSYLMQMLYYIASCKSMPVHITRIRETFGIDENTITEASRGLVHSDAIIISLESALKRLDNITEFFVTNDVADILRLPPEARDNNLGEDIELAEQRLIAAGQMQHVEALEKVRTQLVLLLQSDQNGKSHNIPELVSSVSRGIVDVKLDLEHKLKHGLHSSYEGKDFEARETVVTATFRQMAAVENHLHEMLRRNVLKAALSARPDTAAEILHLSTALKRYLNKFDDGHAELRQAVRDADSGVPDTSLLYELSLQFLDQLEGMSDREALDTSLDLLGDIAGALHFAGMQREGAVIDKCRNWLHSASEIDSVTENEALRCFADAFAQIELHLQRSLIDPLDDTAPIIALAEDRAAELDKWDGTSSPGRGVVDVVTTDESASPAAQVQDAEIPAEFRDVFIEESEEMVAELSELTTDWLQNPENESVLRDIRRHFHTFKGNGRAVGANVLGELGWAAQDLLDRSLDGELEADESVQSLVNQLVAALPELVKSYGDETGPDVDRIRELTKACFEMAAGESEESDSERPGVASLLSNLDGLQALQPVAKTLAR